MNKHIHHLDLGFLLVFRDDMIEKLNNKKYFTCEERNWLQVTLEETNKEVDRGLRLYKIPKDRFELMTARGALDRLHREVYKK